MPAAAGGVRIRKGSGCRESDEFDRGLSSQVRWVNVVAFDIETVPDVAGGRRMYGLDGIPDADVARAMQQRAGRDFLPHHLHRVVAISVALRDPEGQFHVKSIGSRTSDERDLIARFFGGVARWSPTLVSWNGGGFDLPVLHYRSLLHGVKAPRYWETGEDDSAFRWNNYLNRFHWRHLDLMDVLSGYQGRAVAPLDDISTLLGLPGKLGMRGSQVWDRYLSGEIDAIRDYCDTDVVNTFLVYLRFELIRGHLSDAAYEEELERVRETLLCSGRDHLQEFVRTWRATPGSP